MSERVEVVETDFQIGPIGQHACQHLLRLLFEPATECEREDGGRAGAEAEQGEAA